MKIILSVMAFILSAISLRGVHSFQSSSNFLRPTVVRSIAPLSTLAAKGKWILPQMLSYGVCHMLDIVSYRVRAISNTFFVPIVVAVVGGGKKGGGGGGGGGGRNKRPKNPFASTIILPETEFSQRANAIKREPEIQDFWKSYDLYGKLSKAAEESGAERFVLHDGPPYANGDLHIGHALNKLLKDFINRKQVLNNKQVHYVPGWDCHGLPIELKVLQTMKSKERQSLTPVSLRERAANFARETVEKQSASFQRYGVMGDFDHPYLTLQPEFEAAQIRVFGEMFQKGFIFRGRKPVHWSPSSRTALAEAELEYPEGHVSKSIYVGFEVSEASDALREYHSGDNPLKVAIWTTTPWTMPANLAVAINPDLSYSIVEHSKTGKLIVATDLVDSLAVRYQDTRYFRLQGLPTQGFTIVNCLMLFRVSTQPSHVVFCLASLCFYVVSTN